MLGRIAKAVNYAPVLGSHMGDLGRGAGSGGGGGGTIRSAGGAFGKLQVKREEEYFYKKQKEVLEKLKSKLKQDLDFHKKVIEAHSESLKVAVAKLNETEILIQESNQKGKQFKKSITKEKVNSLEIQKFSNSIPNRTQKINIKESEKREISTELKNRIKILLELYLSSKNIKSDNINKERLAKVLLSRMMKNPDNK